MNAYGPAFDGVPAHRHVELQDDLPLECGEPKRNGQQSWQAVGPNGGVIEVNLTRKVFWVLGTNPTRKDNTLEPQRRSGLIIQVYIHSIRTHWARGIFLGQHQIEQTENESV